MIKYALPLFFSLALLTLPSLAQAPRVVTDIAPVHSLVAQVMKGVGRPDLLAEQSASPHQTQLRPSQARKLEQADLLVWVGPELTPWLGRALDGLSPANTLGLLDLPTTQNRPFDAAAEEEHADDEDPADDHDDREADTQDHGHGRIDPHAWLDPVNGAAWLVAIAEDLARIDPEHAATYRENAVAARFALSEQTKELTARLDAVELPALVTAHQAYGHFAARFPIPLPGYVSLSDAAAPSAGHISELRDRLAPLGKFCLFTEPELDATRTAAMLNGLDIVVLELDLLGSRQTPGEALYGETLAALGQAFLTCAEEVK